MSHALLDVTEIEFLLNCEWEGILGFRPMPLLLSLSTPLRSGCWSLYPKGNGLNQTSEIDSHLFDQLRGTATSCCSVLKENWTTIATDRTAADMCLGLQLNDEVAVHVDSCDRCEVQMVSITGNMTR